MGLFDKLKFWEKKEEPFQLEKGAGIGGLGGEYGGGFDQTAGLGGTEPLGPFPTGAGGATGAGMLGGNAGGFESSATGLRPSPLEEREGYARPRPMPLAPAPDLVSKDIEIVSAKLDSIRASIESLSARMSAMEQDLQRLVRKGGW